MSRVGTGEAMPAAYVTSDELVKHIDSQSCVLSNVVP